MTYGVSLNQQNDMNQTYVSQSIRIDLLSHWRPPQETCLTVLGRAGRTEFFIVKAKKTEVTGLVQIVQRNAPEYGSLTICFS